MRNIRSLTAAPLSCCIWHSTPGCPRLQWMQVKEKCPCFQNRSSVNETKLLEAKLYLKIWLKMWWCFVDTFWRLVRLNNKPTDCKTPNVRLHMFVSFREDLPTDDQQQNIAIIFLHRNNRQYHVHVLYYRIRFNMWLSHQQISREIYIPCT